MATTPVPSTLAASSVQTTITTNVPTTFFNTDTVRFGGEPEVNTKKPQIALLPVSGATVGQTGHTRVNINPYTHGDVASTTMPPTSVHHQFVTPSTTRSTITTVSSTIGFRKPVQHQHRTTPRPPNYPRVQENEIPDSSFVTKPSKMAAARLNMGGIIALGIFGGFVFLAAVITIIVIIIRR